MKTMETKSIPQEVLDHVEANLRECIELLSPYCVELLPKQRMGISKMGVKNTGKVTQIVNELQVAPEYAPLNLNIEKLKADLALQTSLDPIDKSLSDLKMLVSDTKMLAGSESLYACMDYYCTVRRLAEKNDPKAGEIFERLSPLFARSSRTKDKEKSISTDASDNAADQ